MAFLFNRNRQRSNSDICRTTKELLIKLETGKDERVAAQELVRILANMKLTLQGTTGRRYKGSITIQTLTTNRSRNLSTAGLRARPQPHLARCSTSPCQEHPEATLRNTQRCSGNLHHTLPLHPTECQRSRATFPTIRRQLETRHSHSTL